MTRLTPLLFLILFCASSRAQEVKRFDLIIDEIFPDAVPPAGLPAYEFIEVRNISLSAVNLKGWKIGYDNDESVIGTDYLLQPDSFVVLCSNAGASLYREFGPTLPVNNFPSLSNTEGTIILFSPSGDVIHHVSYDETWYGNDLKREGGWSLEMIDTGNPCTGGSNWKASTDSRGGTPGDRNAVDGVNPDTGPPELLRTYIKDSATLIAVFDEPPDMGTAALASNFHLSNNTGPPVSSAINTPLFKEVSLRFAGPLKPGMEYELSVNDIRDCSGNTIGTKRTAKAGVPVVPGWQDIVISEILFNPAKDGGDYVEVYNRSNRAADLKELFIASRNALGEVTGIKPFQSSPYLLFPGEYVVVTADRSALQRNYTMGPSGLVFELSSFPSFPDDKGTVVLLNRQGIVLDELTYNENWHFPLITDPSGVALERINFEQPAADRNNWASAASTAGFGTPGYRNSQLRADLQIQGEITVSPKVFSPDNNGIDDFGLIQYQMKEAGYMANMIIYDAAGTRVRYLLKNALLGMAGQFKWDGLGDSNNKLASGVYILVTEIFNLNGKTKKFRHALILGSH